MQETGGPGHGVCSAPRPHRCPGAIQTCPRHDRNLGPRRQARPGDGDSATGQRLKFRTGNHWNLTHADEAGFVVEHFGGTYTLQGNEYTETQDYGDETWMKDNGKSFKFTVKVEGDTMTQIGVGNPYNEVWKRAK